MIPSRRRHILRESGAALGFVALCLFVLFCQHWHEARQEVADAVAETDRLDPGWRFEDLEAQRQLPPPEKNAALQVLAVQSSLPRGWPRTPAGPNGAGLAGVDDVGSDLPPERQLDDRRVRWLRLALGRAGPALDRARQLADMPEGRYPVAWTADVDSTPCPWSDALIATRPLLQLDALLRNQDGDPEGALTCARALLNVGRSLGQEPFFYGPVSRLGCRFDVVEAIERTLAQGRPAAAALAATQEALRQEEAVPLLLLRFGGHRAMMHRFLTQVDDGKHRLSELG
jgi:hypothetical protein